MAEEISRRDGADGASGPDRASGAGGADGATGASGASGADGASEADAATGAGGADGATGASEADGATGAGGADGATVASGADGATGASGAEVAPKVRAGGRRVERAPVGRRRFDLEYVPAPEATDHVRIRERYGLLIGGKWVEPRSERHLRTFNPATEEPLAEVAEAGEEDVDLAVRAARSAYTRTWSKLPGTERAKYLYRIARILQERPTSWGTPFPAAHHGRSGSRRRSSPGTSRC